MNYFITFLEGIVSFISPCMLPMLPIYLSYLSGDNKADTDDKKSFDIIKPVCFVLGFTLVFCLLGLFAGALSAMLTKYQRIIDVICGAVVIFFGISYLGIINIPFFKGMNKRIKVNSVFSAFLFGVIYSVSLTPCVGAFLGSALALASTSGTALKGLTLLLVYSLGLGIPFLMSALLIDRLKATFKLIKKHYKVINTICGIFLIIVGILMAFGVLNKFLINIS